MIHRILMLSVVLTLSATAHADPTSDCQQAMRWRQLNTPPRTPMELTIALMQGDPYRRAAIALCDADPYAHLKPLPWEVARTTPAPVLCMNVGPGMVSCQ